MHRTGFTAAASVLIILFCGLFSCCNPFEQGARGEEVSILTYNVQTLFDDIADGTEYAEYIPGSDGWNTGLYRKKLTAIARVIREAVDGGPDIVALQEIENRNVLEALAEKLESCGYRYRAISPVEGSALQVAFLSRLPIVSVRSHELTVAPSVDGGSTHPLRNILEVEVNRGERRLTLFNNHWKSKAGGTDEETERLRREAAGVLGARLRAVLEADPGADCIALGDLNESYDEYERADRRYPTALMPAGTEVFEAAYQESAEGTARAESERPKEPAARCDENDRILLTPLPAGGLLKPSSGDPAVRDAAAFYSVWPSDEYPGSYFYGGEWLTLDHFILSAGILDAAGFSFSSFRVVSADFMRKSDGSPLRWYSRTGDGFSDHFPLLLILTAGNG